ncbi:general transcription factor II-I repeat domain-containing protein 2A [Trichonephila clavipes]|nr:general transcription factor II-I repeat domain-containing protein 2A [Trichonephila clavipes]
MTVRDITMAVVVFELSVLRTFENSGSSSPKRKEKCGCKWKTKSKQNKSKKDMQRPLNGFIGKLLLKGVGSQMNITEELLELVSLKGTTTRRDIKDAVINCAQSRQIDLKNLVGIATDGVPSMVINSIKNNPLKHRQLQEYLRELESEYGGIIYYTKIRWLSRGNCLLRFWKLREEIKTFMNNNGHNTSELSDDQWLLDLCFLTDIKMKLNELNQKLQASFNEEVESTPPNLQMELIELQSSIELKSLCERNKIEYYQKYSLKDKFPNLKRLAMRITSAYGTTYRCESFFSKLNLNHFAKRNCTTTEQTIKRDIIACYQDDEILNMCANLVESIPRRVEKAVSVKGRHTPY